MKIENKVTETIKKFNLLNPGYKVICALSGGPDSIAMTSILNSLKDELQIEVVAAHLNHMLRGKESEEDELFVKEFCKDLRIKLLIERRDIKEISRGKNIEAVARKERYEFLEKIRKQESANVIAVGHTMSDLAETVIFNLIKGAGIKGLRGFLPKRGNIIRPLFEVSRTEIENFLEEEGLSYRLDSSNLWKDFSRNLIRIDVIPALKRINPNLEKTILNNCETLRELESFIENTVNGILEKAKLSENTFSIDIQTARELHPFILKTLIQEAFARLTGEYISSKKLKSIERIVREKEFKRIDLKKGFTAYSDQLTLTIKKEEEQQTLYKALESVPENIVTPEGTFEFFFSDVKLEREDIFCFPEKFLKEGIEVRYRKEGDKVKLKCGTKSLKKVFIDMKIPKLRRDTIPIIATKTGDVLWVPGVIKAYIISSKSDKFICVRFRSGTKGTDR